MTKPKNRIYCRAIGRSKMLFETQEKAERFIKFNEEDIKDSGKIKFEKLRPYYCSVCGGWHITHISLKEDEIKEIDDRINKVISMATEDTKKRMISKESKAIDAFEFIKEFDLKSFGNKKAFKRYLNENKDKILLDNIKIDSVFHVLKEIPMSYFEENNSIEEKLSEDEIKEQALSLYNELDFTKLNTKSLINDFIKWEFRYKRRIRFEVITKLRELCGLKI